MTEAELYKELGTLAKSKEKWKESLPYVSSLLTHDSVKIQVKAASIWIVENPENRIKQRWIKLITQTEITCETLNY